MTCALAYGFFGFRAIDVAGLGNRARSEAMNASARSASRLTTVNVRDLAHRTDSFDLCARLSAAPMIVSTASVCHREAARRRPRWQAPVRSAVSAVPSHSSVGSPSSASISRYEACVPGFARAAFPGCTVTTLTPKCRCPS
jgi:hypothetical protein